MKKLASVWLVFLACACGSSSNSNTGSTGGNTKNPNTTTTAAVKVTVNGTLEKLPFLTELDPSDVPYATIALVDPGEVLENPTASPNFLGMVALNANSCTNAGCAFSIPNVDISTLTIGMAAGVIDSRTLAGQPSTATLFPAFTGVSQAAVTAAIASGNLNNVIAFGVRVDGYELLSSALNTNTLMANGMLIGLALNTNQTPFAGAQLTATGYTGRVWYPALDSNYAVTATGTNTQGPTSASGLIVVSPSTATVGLGQNWTLTTAGGSPTWTVPSPLGTAPGFVLIVPFLPDM